MPESVAPNIRNRSYTIAVEVEIDTAEAGGVLFAQGARFGGHALYVKDGKLKYVYNFVGERPVGRPRGHPDRARHLLGLLRAREDDDAGRGDVDTPHRRQGVGEGRIKTQPGKFFLAGEG